MKITFSGKTVNGSKSKCVYNNGGLPDNSLFSAFGLSEESKPLNACLVNTLLFIILIMKGDGLPVDIYINRLKQFLHSLTGGEKEGLVRDDVFTRVLSGMPFKVYYDAVDGVATEIIPGDGSQKLAFWLKCENNHFTLHGVGTGENKLHRDYLEKQKLRAELGNRLYAKELSSILSSLNQKELAANGI